MSFKNKEIINLLNHIFNPLLTNINYDNRKELCYKLFDNKYFMLFAQTTIDNRTVFYTKKSYYGKKYSIKQKNLLNDINLNKINEIVYNLF